MNTSLNSSLIRAESLLGVSKNYEDYISIKIKPKNGECCCFHCWPGVWRAVNSFISPAGPLVDEGDVLIRRDDKEFVLECHESGPEIIVLAAASISLFNPKTTGVSRCVRLKRS